MSQWRDTRSRKAGASKPKITRTSVTKENVQATNYYSAAPSQVRLTDRILETEANGEPARKKRKRQQSTLPAALPPSFNFAPPDVTASPAASSSKLELPVETSPDDDGSSGHIPSPLRSGTRIPLATMSQTATAQPFVDAGTAYGAGPGIRTRTKKTMGEKLRAAEQHFETILRCVLAQEAHAQIPGSCGACDSADSAMYRCRECSSSRGLCKGCILDAHKHLPFHWVEEWTGNFFVRRDLSALGHKFHVGHFSTRCLQSPTNIDPHVLTITHTNGIHEVHVEYCHCPRCPSIYEQLLLAGLMPASSDKPASAFTFDVLDDAHEDTLTSKKSAYDYMRKLRRRTNNACAHAVTDRYREFMQVSRIWRYLKMFKRAGQCHGVKYPNRDSKLLTVPCFACPWEGVNTPSDWRLTPPELRYIYRWFGGADGNHGLQQKTKPRDDTDYSLVGPDGFFNDLSKLGGFLKAYPKDTAKVIQTCSGFKVTRSQRTGKFRHLEITGVVAVTCIRHGTFSPRGVVNLPGGEQFALVDLALSGALENKTTLMEWLLTYDVGCEYLCNILTRWKDWKLPPDLIDVVGRLWVLLPQMHMLAHKEFCQTEYAVCYKQGTGHSNGETVETLWAEHNAVGLSTREMNGGARLDALNDFFNSWNWYKNEGRAKYIARKLPEKLGLQASQTRDLAALTVEAGPERITKWLKLDLDDQAPTPSTYSLRRARPKQSVYALDQSHVPSKGKALKDLLGSDITVAPTTLNDTEAAAVDAGEGPPGSSTTETCSHPSPPTDMSSLDRYTGQVNCLRVAVELELAQAELAARVTKFRESAVGRGTSDDRPATLSSARRSFRTKLQKWFADAQTYIADVVDLLPPIDLDNSSLLEDDLEDLELPQDGPELIPMPLPSRLSSTQRADSKFTQLASCEFRLRLGHAYDVLASVRMSVRKKAALIADKDRNARGTKDNLKSQELIRGVQQRTVFLSRVYNSNLEMLHTVAATSSPTAEVTVPSNLRAIDITKDLQMSGLVARRNLGDSKRTLPWIFRVCGPESGGAESEDGEAWEEETKRTDWFRAWAAKTRTDEEVNLLLAEARALRRGFSYASRVHSECSAALPVYASRGATAYALEKAAMFARMSAETERLVLKAFQGYHTKMVQEPKAGDDDLRDVYAQTQAGSTLRDECLDYSTKTLTLMKANDQERAHIWQELLSGVVF